MMRWILFQAYGRPVLPGAMFMTSEIGGVPIREIPACGLRRSAMIFDLALPRILAGERRTRRGLANVGHGALCRTCKTCRFPDCAFG